MILLFDAIKGGRLAIRVFAYFSYCRPCIIKPRSLCIWPVKCVDYIEVDVSRLAPRFISNSIRKPEVSRHVTSIIQSTSPTASILQDLCWRSVELWMKGFGLRDNSFFKGCKGVNLDLIAEACLHRLFLMFVGRY